MKLVILFAVCVHICAAHVYVSPEAVPTVPGDNSHYVEGQSRYLWMVKGNGEPVLVDLHKSLNTELLDHVARNGAENRYTLFTRRNPNNGELLVLNDASSIRNSNFNPNVPTVVSVHGALSDDTIAPNPEIRDAYLTNGDYNVIVVDWSRLANADYITAVNGVPSVGQHIAELVLQLGTSLANVHLVGFSLGAHVVGNAGRALGGRLARVTGLDPAGPLYTTDLSSRLRRTDAIHVDVIHTDCGPYGLGNPSLLGDSDFYPNGGMYQPGCLTTVCSHFRAPELFQASVYYNHLVGRGCPSATAAMSGGILCSGATSHMGNHHLNKSDSGIFYLSTGTRWPF